MDDIDGPTRVAHVHLTSMMRASKDLRQDW